MEGKSQWPWKKQIQVLVHINADNKKSKIKILYEVFSWEFLQENS